MKSGITEHYAHAGPVGAAMAAALVLCLQFLDECQICDQHLSRDVRSSFRNGIVVKLRKLHVLQCRCLTTRWQQAHVSRYISQQWLVFK